MTLGPDLGRALSQLRSIRGLSLSACAEALQMSEADMQAAEAGNVALACSVASRLHGLSEEDLRDGSVLSNVTVDGVPDATVFLFHGAYQDFDATDLGALERAMRAARLLSASAHNQESLRVRLAFVPLRPAGPAPRDAARQGYKLARFVRRELGLGNEPLGDLRELLEQKLGISVVVEELATTDLRAASIVDAHRSAAAVLLSADDPDRVINPRLARVFLAHELCHVLFDQEHPGAVCIALDDRIPEERTLAASPTTLLESRAKGFAAELLMPLEGLKALLGAPTACAVETQARKLVDQVREHFGTPIEIAINHLNHHGFVENRKQLLALMRGGAYTKTPETKLPTPDAWRTSTDLVAPITATPPTYVTKARKATDDVQKALVDETLNNARSAVEAGQLFEATDIVVDCLDALLRAHRFGEVGSLLGQIDTDYFPPSLLTGSLMVTRHATVVIEERATFLERVEKSLLAQWKQNPEVVTETIERLR